MNKASPEISLIIPVFNEAAHIQKTILLLSSLLLKITDRFEIIVIDDGSTDNTWGQLAATHLLVAQLSAIRLSRNFGKELALCAGLEHCLGDAVIVMDADLQHPPSLLPEMVRLWREQGVDIVECVKTKRGKETLNYKLGSFFFYSLLNKLSGFHLDGASDFKLLDRKVVDAWREMPERNTFFRGMTAWLGYTRIQLTFEVEPRVSGSSRWGSVSLVKLAVNAVVSFSSIPLRFVSFFGVVFFLGAVALGLQTLYRKFDGTAVTGFTTVILLLLFIGSVIMVSLGVIGEYIASIYNEVKKRPRFLIREHMIANSLAVKEKNDENI